VAFLEEQPSCAAAAVADLALHEEALAADVFPPSQANAAVAHQAVAAMKKARSRNGFIFQPPGKVGQDPSGPAKQRLKHRRVQGKVC
jgi:hypothetical protein